MAEESDLVKVLGKKRADKLRQEIENALQKNTGLKESFGPMKVNEGNVHKFVVNNRLKQEHLGEGNEKLWNKVNERYARERNKSQKDLKETLLKKQQPESNLKGFLNISQGLKKFGGLLKKTKKGPALVGGAIAGTAGLGAKVIDKAITRKDGTKSSAILLFIGSLFLWFTDYFVTKFQGFNIDTVIRNVVNFSIGDIALIFLNVVALAIIVLYAFSKKLESAWEWLSFAILVWAFSFLFFISKEYVSGGRAIGALFHLGFASLVLLDMKRNYEGQLPSFYRRFVFLVATDFFFYSIILKILGGWSLEKVFIIPFWTFYTLWSMRLEKGTFKTIATIIIIFMLIGGNAPLYAKIMEGGGGGGGTEISQTNVRTKNLLQASKEAINQVISGIKRTYNESISYATGDYYTGKVDNNVEEELGVYIGDIETLDPKSYEDEDIEIWGVLHAKSLEEPIKQITINCTANPTTKKEVKGDVKINEFRDFIDEKEDIDCKFEAGSLEKGANIIVFDAEFDFTTLAYLKTYFINDERLKALTREDIDVFKEYGIRDENPVAIFTNGPVGIGMETKEPPIGISEDYDSMPKFGFTIESKWPGKIKEIKEFFIYLPEGIKLSDNCDNVFESIGVTRGYDDYKMEGYNGYRLVDGVKIQKKWKNIKDYRSRNCRLEIKDPDKILGESPISVKYIKARIEYVYNSEESISIDVRTPEGFNVYFEPKQVTLDDNVIKCVASHSSLYISKAPFEIYKPDDDEETRTDDEEPVYKEEVPCGSSKQKCEIPISKEKLKTWGFKRGDKIKCKVYKATLSNKEIETDAIITTIQNSAPAISVELDPKSPTDNIKEIKCIGKISDPEKDEVMTTYDIRVNDKDYFTSSFECKDNTCTATIQKEDNSNFKEGDKIYCAMTAVDFPLHFESKESEKDYVTVKVARSNYAKTDEKSSDYCEECYLKCKDTEGKPIREGLACGYSTKKNCYKGECIRSCRYYAITVSKVDWYCKWAKDGWTKEKCEGLGKDKCLTDKCPNDGFCVRTDQT